MMTDLATVTAAKDDTPPFQPLSLAYGFKSWICLKQLLHKHQKTPQKTLSSSIPELTSTVDESTEHGDGPARVQTGDTLKKCIRQNTMETTDL